MIRVHTPSRLHFGLLSVPAAQMAAWPNQEGTPVIPRRPFGGVGLMIDRPGIELTVEPTSSWHAEGPLADRALTFGKRFCASVGLQQAFRVRIDAAAPEHTGLGTGTQLGLAIAYAIAQLSGRIDWNSIQLAPHVGRGLRSALGIHGFTHGGFLVEAGKRADTSIAPLVFHHDFPADWHILLITPRDMKGYSGIREVDAFAGLANQARDDRVTESLCRIVLLGMLPALLEQDLAAFGESVYDFNRRVGTLFQPAQGGIYAHPGTEALIKRIRAAGVPGVGQSSWGPTVFAIVQASQAIEFRDWLTRQAGVDADDVMVAKACNRGCTS